LYNYYTNRFGLEGEKIHNKRMEEIMHVITLFRNGMLLSVLALILCATLALAQDEAVGTETTKQSDPLRETAAAAPKIDPAVDAEFDVRIADIRADAEARVADLEAAAESSQGEDREGYLREVESVNRTAEIEILEVRAEQETARGNKELSDKFVRAAEMLRNPAPRQTPDPEADKARFDQQRTQNKKTR
jgi:hypothetical protein